MELTDISALDVANTSKYSLIFPSEELALSSISKATVGFCSIMSGNISGWNSRNSDMREHPLICAVSSFLCATAKGAFVACTIKV